MIFIPAAFFCLTSSACHRDNNINHKVITPVHEAGRGAVLSGTAPAYFEGRQ